MGKHRQDFSFGQLETFFSFKGKMFIAALLGLGGCILSWSPILFPKMGLIIANFAFLPIFLSGFAFGILGGTVSAGFFLVAAVLMGGIGVGIWSGISMLLILWMIRQSLLFREKDGISFFYPEGRLLVSLIILSFGVLVLGVLFLKPILLTHMQIFEGRNITSVQEMIFLGLKEYLSTVSLNGGMILEVLQFLASYGPALFLTSWILTLFVNAFIALSLLKKWGKSLRPPFCMQTIDLTSWYPWMLIVPVLLSFAGGDLGFIGENASALALLGFVFQGISVFHVGVDNIFEKDSSMPKIILGFFYSLVILFPLILGILAGLGILEQFMHLRNRIMSRVSKRVN